MYKNLLKSCFFAALALLCASATAQISHGGAPRMLHRNAPPIGKHLDSIDTRKLLEEDLTSGKGTALRVGVVREFEIDNFHNGAHTFIEDSSLVWLGVITSPGATHISINFSQFELAEGAELFVYDQSREFVIGAFTSENRMEDGTFYTQSIPGQQAIIELVEPAEVAGQSRITIDHIVHGYKTLPMFEKGQHGSADGNCHINVVCPEGDDWRDQIRSVVSMEIQAGYYSFACTGALVNNTAQDRTPYILSAYHCQNLSQYGNISKWTFYFNYQTNTCAGNYGPSGNSMTGCDIVAKYQTSGGTDMLLLKLKNSVPDSYKPYYSGWDRRTSALTKGSCIHHPGGDYKKISLPEQVSSNDANYIVAWWYKGTNNKGVTEGGSSGSPLFNANKRIIGQLYGGASECGAADNAMYDLYGKLSKSWTGGNATTNRLSDWLDPTGSGVQYLDGLDYKDPDPVAISEATASPLRLFPSPTSGMVYLDVDALGEANYKVFSLDGRCALEGSTVLTSTAQAINLSSLPKGAYRLVLFTSGRAYSASIVKN